MVIYHFTCIACLNEQFDVVKYLITEQKCDPNSRGEGGYKPLHCALLTVSLPLIKYFIKDCGKSKIVDVTR